MKTYPYKCKFCGRPGEIKLHDEFSGTFEKLLDLACCNRCGDFYSAKSALIERIKIVCIAFYQGRMASPKSAPQLEADTREKLPLLTKKLARLCCDYLRISNVWEPEFVDQLIENPRRCEFICGQYFKGLADIAKQAKEAHPAPPPM